MFKSSINFALVLSLFGLTYAEPIYQHADKFLNSKNDTVLTCTAASSNPACHVIKQPRSEVMQTILLPDGTWSEPTVSNWTRESLAAKRKKHGVISNLRKGDEGLQAFHHNLTKRESAPQVCSTYRQTWFDQHEWGNWYQQWKQVGGCYYCSKCTERITQSFGVSQTWTVGLEVNFESIIKASFGFSQGQTSELKSALTCQWNPGETHNCHSIWFQPLMTYHNGYANYQTHQHCYAGGGEPASDFVYDHHYAFVNVNEGPHGSFQGNFGCGSGCQGSDHNQCWYGNDGGVLWPRAN